MFFPERSNELRAIPMRRRIAAALLAVLLLLSALCLGACNAGQPGVTTTGGGSTSVPATTVPPVEDDGSPPTEEELDRFFTLVDREKVSVCEQLYSLFSVVEPFRSYDELYDELRAYLAAHYRVRRIVTRDVATAVAVSCYTAVLGDRYASYYLDSDYESFMNSDNGMYVGIGVTVTQSEEKYFDVLSVAKDSPAQEAGILPGDLVIAVEGQSVVELGYYESINRIRGEEGTTVTITVRRGDTDTDFTVRRAKLIEYSVEYEMRRGNIGYIRITSFDGATFGQFKAAYDALEAAGAESFLFDVRNNPGGDLDAVLAVLEYLLPDGPIVSLRYKSGEKNTYSSVYDFVAPGHSRYQRYNELMPQGSAHSVGDKPIAVLCNENTASAGELFTSAIRDYAHDRKVNARIIGTTTYGKGVGQNGYGVGQNGLGSYGTPGIDLLMLTTFYYDPPCGENYNGVGITPDEECPLPEEVRNINLYRLTEEQDTQLLRAYELLGVGTETE